MTALISASFLPCVLAAETAVPQAEVSQQKLLESFDALANTLNQAKQQVSNAVAERDQALKALSDTRKTVGDQERLIAELRTQLAESQKSAQGWEQKSKQHENAAAEWKKKAGELDQRLAIGKEAQEHMASFRSRLEKTMNEFGAMETELAKLRDELRTPRDMALLVKQNETLKQNLATSSKRLQEKSAAGDKAEANLANSLRDLARTKVELQNLRKAHDELKQGAQASMKALTEKGEVAVKEARAETNKALEAMTAAKDRAEGLARKLDTSERKLNETESKLALAEKRQAELNGELSKRKEAIESLREKLESQQAKQEQKDKGQEQANAAGSES